MSKNYEMLIALRDELDSILSAVLSEDSSGSNGKESTSSETSSGRDYEDMSYIELKKLCKSRGISAVGNKDELIEKLVNDDENSTEEEEAAEVDNKVKKISAKKPAKTVKKEEPEEEPEEDDEPSIQEQVEDATADMTLEELADFCEENGISSKGKRQALISRIVKAVEAGDIELSDGEEDEEDEEPAPKKGSKSSKSKKVEEPDEDEEDEDEDDDDEESGEPTKERIAALKSYKKDTTSQFKDGELDRDDLIEFLCEFHGKDKKAYRRASDEDILEAYIEASSNLINDDGEIVEEGAYTVNGVPYCCGRPLTYSEDDEQYVCEHCGSTYDAE